MSIYNDSAFDEMILAHLVTEPSIYNKAKKIRLQSDDFLTSTTAGIYLYKSIADVIFRLDLCPCPRPVLDIELNQLAQNDMLDGVPMTEVQALVDWLYTSDKSVEYVEQHLIDFVKHRRFSKIKQDTTDPSELYTQLITADAAIPKTDGAVTVSPFATPILCTTNFGLSTGFTKLDTSLGGGFHKEECGLILAASGSGKTSLGVNFCVGAMRSHNIMYISLEEPMEHLVQRFYARLFDLPYTKLKNGDVEQQQLLIERFNGVTDIERSMFSRLKVVDGRNLCPVTYKGIEELIEKAAQEEGFVTDAILIDQLDFMAPYKTRGKKMEKWQEYEQIAAEIDTLSLYKVGGTNPISVWVLHQIHGKPLWEYTYDNIAGYKGVVKPFDLAIGAGRYPGKNYINVHSLKTRHGQPFAHTYNANFATMTFTEATWQPPRDRRGEIIYKQDQQPEEDRFKDTRVNTDDLK